MDEWIELTECPLWLGRWWVTGDGCYETRPGVVEVSDGYQATLEVSYLGGDVGSRWVGDRCLKLSDAKAVARSAENTWHSEYEGDSYGVFNF